MYHSIIINDEINTWDDWHLIPASRPLVAPPEVVTKFVEIPGLDGSVDLTEALTGYPTYTRRTGSWQFIVANGYGEWEARYSEIMNYIHGQECTIKLEDDPGYYYEGRLKVENWDSGKNFSMIEIGYELMPFKRDLFSSTDDWLWDDFNFEVGVIRDYSAMRVDGSLTITVVGSSGRIIPDLITSAPMTVEYNNVTMEYEAAGIYHMVDFPIVEGEHNMTFTGNGIVTLSYRGGML